MFNSGDTTVGCGKPYLEYFKQFGTVILLSPDTFLPNLDLLVLPGGKDVANGNSEDFSYYNSDNERFLEWFDANTLPKYIKNLTPIFSICRGMQAITKFFGMPLVQNIWWDHGYSKDTEDLKAHKILYTKECRDLVKDLNLPKECESFHHQGLLLKNVNIDEFTVLATDNTFEEYKIVEYMIHNNLPIACVQGHPERSHGQLSKFLINKLLNNKNEN